MGKFKRYNLSRRKKRLSESTPPLEDEIYEITSTLPKEEEIINQESPQSIEDIITEDGILCSILSSLSLKEAVGTCVLSSRWRHLWTNLPKLHFNAANMFDTHTVSLLFDDDTLLTKKEQTELMKEKTNEFISSVGSVIQQLQGRRTRIDEFIVQYFLHKFHSDHLDAWVRFVVTSKTKVLALNFQKPSYLHFDGERYDFPCHLLGSSSTIEILILVFCSLKSPCSYSGFSQLKRLTLQNINVTEEDITLLLSNCYNLQFLKLHTIPQLVTLSIPKPLSQLQTLIVNNCAQLTGEINITAENLTTICYNGYLVDFSFRQSTQLVEAHIIIQTDAMEPNLEFYLNKLSHNLPQLQRLVFTIYGDSQVPDLQKEINSFTHLTGLDWCWNVYNQKMSLHHLTTLLDATPLLEELILRLQAKCPIEKAPERLRKLRETLPDEPHPYLKTVWFVDFYWDLWHVEFLLYLRKNATQLRTLKIANGSRGLDKTTIRKILYVLPQRIELVVC